MTIWAEKKYNIEEKPEKLRIDKKDPIPTVGITWFSTEKNNNKKIKAQIRVCYVCETKS